MVSYAMSLRAHLGSTFSQRPCTSRLLLAAPQQHSTNSYRRQQVLARAASTATMPAVPVVNTKTAAPPAQGLSNVVSWQPPVLHTVPVETQQPIIDFETSDPVDTWIYGNPFADSATNTQLSPSTFTTHNASIAFKNKWPCGMRRFTSPLFMTTSRDKHHRLKTQPRILQGLYFHHHKPSPMRMVEVRRADDPTGAIHECEVAMSVAVVKGSAAFREEMRQMWVANNSWMAGNSCWIGSSSSDDEAEFDDGCSSSDEDHVESSQHMEVPFAISCPTEPGQQVFITGNVPSLGGWNLANALQLKWSAGHVWRGSIKLPSGFRELVQFKAVLLNEGDSSWVWQQGPNRTCKVLPSMSAVELVFQ